MSTYYTNSYLTGSAPGSASYGAQLGPGGAAYGGTGDTRRPQDGSPLYPGPRSPPPTSDYSKYGPYNGHMGSPTSPGPTSPASSTSGSLYGASGADYTRRLQSPPGFSPTGDGRPPASSPSPGHRKELAPVSPSAPGTQQLAPINMSNHNKKAPSAGDRPASASSSTSPTTADEDRDDTEFDDDNSVGSSGENSNAGNGGSSNIPIYPWMKSQFDQARFHLWEVKKKEKEKKDLGNILK